MISVKEILNATLASIGVSIFSSSYWSSTEYNHSYAYCINFNNGCTCDSNKNNSYYVRAVRAL